VTCDLDGCRSSRCTTPASVPVRAGPPTPTSWVSTVAPATRPHERRPGCTRVGGRADRRPTPQWTPRSPAAALSVSGATQTNHASRAAKKTTTTPRGQPTVPAYTHPLPVPSAIELPAPEHTPLPIGRAVLRPIRRSTRPSPTLPRPSSARRLEAGQRSRRVGDDRPPRQRRRRTTRIILT
jgi:hypothetical protein